MLILSASTTGWLLTHELGKMVNQVERDFGRLNLSDPVQDEARRVAEGIAAACEYIDALKALREGLPQRIRAVDIGELVEGVRRQLSFEDQARVERWNGPPVFVCGVKPLLGAIVGNLILNAVKHAKGYRIYPSLQFVQDSAGEKVVFRIEDEGPDIPDTIVGDLFRPSVASLLKQLAGTGGGLGLPLIRTYVELHTGRIEYIRSDEGRRKAFVVTLPKGTPPTLKGDPQP
jgi:signal transduction histidine kinase